MSALARHFYAHGYEVYGYDRTPSPLTRELEQEGISVVYSETLDAFPFYELLSPVSTQVVYTPAVPTDSVIFRHFREGGYDMLKRSEVLGMVTRRMKALCVAGTHGKTTTSTLLAHLLYQSEIGTNAFLGGISNNYHSNLLTDVNSSYVVVEADEYDRSFHRLSPYMTVVTSCDPDHLDIYGTEQAYRESFEHYLSLVSGAVVIKEGLGLAMPLQRGVKAYTYGVRTDDTDTENLPDFYANHIEVKEGQIYFDFHTPTEELRHVRLGVPVWINIENSVAAMAMAWLNGVGMTELRTGLSSFDGVYRRFNVHVQTDRVAYIDDYAHHPEELRASIESVRRLYPQRKLIAIFQPHLYSRTRDFADEFAGVLSMADGLLLLPIYPARELPIEGVTSRMLLERVSCPAMMVEKADLVETVVRLADEAEEPVVVLTVGAGDIDRLVQPLKEALL